MARAGLLKPEAEISQSADGPWRPAKQLRGLVFPEPELPPPPKPDPFETFADSGSRNVPADAGILLEAASSPAEEPDPPLTFDAAPPPTAVAATDGSVPSFASSVTGFVSGRLGAARPYPEYSALTAYGWLFRVGGAVLFGLGIVAFLESLASPFWVEPEGRAQVLVAGAGALVGCVVIGFLLLIPGDAILAFVDLVRDARRQRIAAERTLILLDEAFSRRAETAAETSQEAG